MASRIGGGPPSSLPTPAATPDNRLEQMREKQLKELMEMRLASTRNDGEHVLENVTRRLRQVNDNPSLRNTGSTTPDLRRPDGQRPDQRVPTQNPSSPSSSAPSTSSPSSPSSQAGQGQAQQPGASAPPGLSRQSVQDFPRLVADFQRQQGLPVTGRLDQGTVAAMKDKGIVPQQPTANTERASEARDAGPRATKEDVTATRLNRAAAEQARKQRLDSPPMPSRSRENATNAQQARNDPRGDNTPMDRALDPSRLLASLAMAGFAGKGKAALEEAVKSFQEAQGLPPTGKLDAQTQEALKTDGHIDPNASGEPPSKPTTSDKPVEQKQQVRRALVDNQPTTKNAADRDVVKDPLRPQANTSQQTTTADVAARAPVTAESAAAEKARLDTVVAQQAASERGVQEGKGDPNASKGHGEVAGEGAGQKGAGGISGGGSPDSTAASGAMGENVAGLEGDETAVGNAEAGDDDFENEERGNANMGDADDQGDAPGDEGEHWEVPPLSEQVREALEKIMRDDEGSGPVTYTWDVTFLRPGKYASGQPAEELWHVAVHKATAFDPVWQQAADAISSRMLYGEPDAEAPTIDDFILALRRARVR